MGRRTDVRLGAADREALGSAAPDGPVLGVRVEDEQEKAALLAQDAEVFFTTPHFDGSPTVLVRLDFLGPETLAELVEDAWRCRASARHVAELVARSS